MARYFLSPSRVARYYFHECDRYLRYTATPQAIKAEEGIPPYELDHSLLTKAILESGYTWETEVLDGPLKASAVLAPPPPDQPDAPKTNRVHSFPQTVAALGSAVAGQFIYQPTLVAPREFYERYDIDPELVGFTECRPDLLMIRTDPEGQGLEVVVLDLKATDEAKLSHRIQATLYTMILEAVLEAYGITSLRVSRQGGVWLYRTDEPELFDLAAVRPPLETFLRSELEPVLRKPAGEAFWHLYFRCEWCDFYKHCRSQAEETNDISLVPHLSTFAKRHLAETGATTVDGLDSLLKREDADDILKGTASLRGKRRRLQLSVDALKTGELATTGAASVAMPKFEDVRIILTLQSEPLAGEIYGYGIYRFGGAQAKGKPVEDVVFGEWSDTIARVAPTNSEVDLRALRRNLIRDLIAILQPIDEFNRAHPSDQEWRMRKSVQAYVFDTYERELLVKALLEASHDDDRDIAEQAMTLFFHFQHTDLAAADDHPATEVFFPVVALTQVVRSTFALPIKVVYRFADVVACLQPSRYGFIYTHHATYDFELSNRMKSDSIYYAWFKGERANADKIAGQLKLRLWAANSVINGIRERLDATGALFAYPPKFALPPGMGFRDRLLSRLAFVSRYEYVLGYLDTRMRRGAAEPERIATADSIRLTFLGGDRYRVDPGQLGVDIAPNNYGAWILTPDTPAGRRARLAFDDALYRDRHYAPRNLDLALVDVLAAPLSGVVRLRLKPSKSFTMPKEGDVLILEERATDFNTENLIKELAALDAETDPWFVRLVRDPVASRRKIVVPSGIRNDALALASRARMTSSQLMAFAGLVDHNLQLVWGPPGTGKTHFLGVAILSLAEAHRRAGKPLRVLLTGFTHAAIDNALRKLNELQRSTRTFAGGLPVRKVGSRCDAAPEIPHGEAPLFADDHPICVLGATVWQTRKIDPADLAFDLVIVDEGSQLQVAASAIPIRRLHPRGRLLIAGDDKQLPPIVQGNYKIPEGEPLLHRSILESLRDQDPDDVTVAPLLENFRMCDVLCEYPAASIYPPAYAPATPQIAARRLDLKRSPNGGALGRMLDPAHPMVMCVMEGGQSGAENIQEAQMVADLANRLRELTPNMTDEEFWTDRLFIVSPHHAQIRAIKAELRRRREWSHEPFVDTVDKMQGQECDVVLVSYGVSDVEYALREKEFIYSMNRLNVAITRGRMKTVVFLSRTLLEPPLQALDQDDVAAGIAFMQGLATAPSTRVMSI